MALFHNSAITGASGNQGGGAGYQISRSLRFNSSDSAYCGRTFSTPTTQNTFTFAAWIKRAALGTTQHFFGVSTNHSFGFTSGDALNLTFAGGSALTTTALFRDPSAWYHIVWTQSGTSHTLYVNNVSVGTATSTSSVFNTAVAHQIGAANTANYFNGYLADIHFIDGQALTPSSFTEVSATTGRLEPKAYSGPTPTGNSFWLSFSDNSAATATTLGKDNFNLGNNWTPNNVSVSTGGPTSVAAASGALPVYNTTDTYGTTKGTGTRTDANASSLSLAVPMDGTNGGTTFTDESATIRGSGSAKTVTPTSTSTSTARSKYYGSSGLFSAGRLTIPTSTDLDLTGDFTLEAWVYIPSSTPSVAIIWNTSANGNASSSSELQYLSSVIYFYNGGSGGNIVFSTIPGFNQWFHVAVTRAGSTTRIFINGILQQTSTTVYSLITGQAHYIGDRPPGAVNANYPFAGNIQDFRIYKGVAKYTSNFDPPTATQNTALAPGNDSLVDTPTSGSQVDTGLGGEVRGNYATLNPLAKGGALTLSNGNLDVSDTGATSPPVGSTLAVSSGKWYYEQTIQSPSAYVGLSTTTAITTSVSFLGGVDGQLMYNIGGVGSSYLNGSIYNYSTASTATTGDVIGVALNFDTGVLTFYKNGVSQGAFGTNVLAGKTYTPAFKSNVSASASFNFGQRPFAYTAPSGFKALCDTNLPAPVIAKPSTVMDVKLYTGNGSTQTISGLNFSPDLVWIKERNAAADHALYDIARGTQNRLESNTTDAAATSDNGLTAFNSDGFALGSLAQVNTNADTYVAWAWDAGSSTVTNTQGSITSQVRANASAGFSIVTYTGNNTGGATVGHGLSVKPALIIVKSRSVDGWAVRHDSLANNQYLFLNSTGAAATSLNLWFNTAPTSAVFSVNSDSNVNGASTNYVAYCFAPVAGLSSYGTYQGNGSADGPMVFANMRPRWIMLKRTDTTSNWTIIDTAREGYNVDNDPLYPNLADAEGTADLADILSNGFKLRSTDASVNASAGTYVYAAFAESPFQYARAR